MRGGGCGHGGDGCGSCGGGGGGNGDVFCWIAGVAIADSFALLLCFWPMVDSEWVSASDFSVSDPLHRFFCYGDGGYVMFPA